jgi:hypothetical protein
MEHQMECGHQLFTKNISGANDNGRFQVSLSQLIKIKENRKYILHEKLLAILLQMLLC